MTKLADLSGQQFGRLTAIRICRRRLGPNNKMLPPEWECVCTCGKTLEVPAKMLLSGHKKSCGCLKSEMEPPAKKVPTSLMESERMWGPCPYPKGGCKMNQDGWCCDDCDRENCSLRCQNLPQKCGCKRL